MRFIIAAAALLAQCAIVAALPNFEHHHHNALARRVAQNDALVVRSGDDDTDLEARGDYWDMTNANIRWWGAKKFQNPSCGGAWPTDDSKVCIVSTKTHIPCWTELKISINGKSTTCVVAHRRHGWSQKRIRVTKSVYLRLTDKADDGKLKGVRVKVMRPDQKKHKHDDDDHKHEDDKKHDDDHKKHDEKKEDDDKKKKDDDKSQPPGGKQMFGNAHATYFLQGGNAGNCGQVSSDDDYIVALPSSMYDNGSHCGKRVRIWREGSGKVVEARVADSCPSCITSTSLDLSRGAFKAIATEAEGMVNIKWCFI